MKKIFATGMLLMIIQVVTAQVTGTTIIKITGTKFPFDIMQQWITAYNKVHPEIKFQLSKAIPPDSADLIIAAHAFRDGELKESQAVIAVNRYAQLPIVNSNRKDIGTLQERGFTQTDMTTIYFGTNSKSYSSQYNAFDVYKRNKNVCASRSFAENVSGKQQDVNGTLVDGDDRALSAAVKNDENGISYNSLGLIYDLTTRKIFDSIAIVPIDLNENGKIDRNENFYTTLDDVLNFLAIHKEDKIPQENVNIVFDRNTKNIAALTFLNWIITEGEQYNRRFGFLNLDNSVIARQQVFLNSIVKNNSTVLKR